jgi:hypothetical protein
MGIIILLAFLFFLNEQFYRRVSIRHPFANISLIRKIFLWHLLFTLVYYLYAIANPSDSKQYYDVLTKLNFGWLETISMTNWGVWFFSFRCVYFMG